MAVSAASFAKKVRRVFIGAPLIAGAMIAQEESECVAENFARTARALGNGYRGLTALAESSIALLKKQHASKPGDAVDVILGTDDAVAGSNNGSGSHLIWQGRSLPPAGSQTIWYRFDLSLSTEDRHDSG